MFIGQHRRSLPTSELEEEEGGGGGAVVDVVFV
jgi:hypothetical protein